MRAPYNVLVIPYRRSAADVEFLVGRRSDDGAWQAISGGGEDNERPLQAAARELLEETGLTSADWTELDSRASLPRIHFSGHELWTDHPYVITEFSFGALVTNEPSISDEHDALRWYTYSNAYNLLRYDSNRNALWELNERLSKAGTPRGSLPARPLSSA